MTNQPVPFASEPGSLPLLEPLLGIHGAASASWLAAATATASERGLGALYSVLLAMDGSGRLVTVMPASASQKGALARLSQFLGLDLPTAKLDLEENPELATLIADGRAAQIGVLHLAATSRAAAAAQPAGAPAAPLAALAAPLRWNGETSGVLLLFTARGSAIDPGAAELLARHVAVALANLLERDASRKRGEIDAVRWVYDERRFLDELDQEARRAKRHQRPLSVLLVRVLNFEELRASYGRFLAERVLRQVAGRLDDAMRDTDFLGASGDDGFGAILIEADHEGAEVAERRLQSGLAEMSLPHTDLPDLDVHLGFATATQPHDGETPDALMAVAEARLREEIARQQHVSLVQ